MIETFVRERVANPEDWFVKIPQFQRVATNPVEKKLFLGRICEIVERIADGDSLTAKPSVRTPTSSSPEHPAPAEASAAQISDVSPKAGVYAVAEMGAIGVKPEPERFYEPVYAAVLRRMVAHVIEVEAPIYDDVLVTRIARAHGFHRSGDKIRKAVLAAVDRAFPRITEGGRGVFWRQGSATSLPVPYRRGPRDLRPHENIPIPELAGFVLSFVNLRMTDEQILEKMAQEFELGRLREATRSKFARAISLARTAPQPGRRAGPANNIDESSARASPGTR